MMWKYLGVLAALAGGAGATTIDRILDQSRPLVRMAEIFLDVRDDLRDAVPPGQVFGVERGHRLEETALVTIGGGTGRGIVVLSAEVFGYFIQDAGNEICCSAVTLFLDTSTGGGGVLPMGMLGNGDLTPNSCSGCLGFEFTYGEPFVVRVTADTFARYTYTNNGSPPQIPGTGFEEFLRPFAAMQLDAVGIFDPGTGFFRVNPDAVFSSVTVVPEPGTFGLAVITLGLGLGLVRLSRRFH